MTKRRLTDQQAKRIRRSALLGDAIEEANPVLSLISPSKLVETRGERMLYTCAYPRRSVAGDEVLWAPTTDSGVVNAPSRDATFWNA